MTISIMLEYEKETLEHIELVGRFIDLIANRLTMRGINHDMSKLESPEREIFKEYLPWIKTSAYGTKEHDETLKKMRPALEHHYANNPHHTEFHSDGINGMNLVDLVEMFCDWVAVSMDKGDFHDSLKISSIRFNMSKQLETIFENTANVYFRHETARKGRGV